MNLPVSIFCLDPRKSMENTEIRITHFARRADPAQQATILRAKAVDHFNFVNRVSITFRETDGIVLTHSCPCRDAAMIPQILCRHCSALAEYYLHLTNQEIKTAPDIYDEPVDQPQDDFVLPVLSDPPLPEPAAAVVTGTLPDADAVSAEKSALSPAAALLTEWQEPVFSVNDEPRSMEIVLGHARENGEPLVWYPNDTQKLLHTNMGIIGTMGTGKTQFTKSVVAQLCHQQQNNLFGSPLGVLIFDYKGDYNESKPEFVEAVNARVMKPYRLPFNPFVLSTTDKFIPRLPVLRASMIRDTMTKNYRLGDIQQSTLIDSIIHAYAAAGIDPDRPETWDRTAPTFAQVYAQYEKDTGGKVNDSLSNAMKMIHQFGIFESDPAKAVALKDLLHGVVVIDLSGYDEKLQHLVVAITLDLFYSQMHALGSSRIAGQFRQMKYFILVDEADHFMRQRFASLEKIMKEGREFGVGTILSTQSLHHFFGSAHDDYAQYILTWDVHNVKDLKQREVEYLLSRDQTSAETAAMHNYIKSQRKHESVVMLTEAGTVSPIPIDDLAFWQFYEEWKQGADDGGLKA